METCSLCLDDINSFHIKTVCSHYYCFDCLLNYINSECINSNKCPMCRYTFFEIEEEEPKKINKSDTELPNSLINMDNYIKIFKVVHGKK